MCDNNDFFTTCLGSVNSNCAGSTSNPFADIALTVANTKGDSGMKADNPFASVKLAAPLSSDTSKNAAVLTSEGAAGGFSAFTKMNPFLSGSGTGLLSNISSSGSNESTADSASTSTAATKGPAVGFSGFKDPFKAMKEAAVNSSSRSFLDAAPVTGSGPSGGSNSFLGSSFVALGSKPLGNKEANDQEDDNEGDANYDPEAEVVITLPEGTFR